MATFECPNCGNAISESEKQCKYCGTSNPHYNGKNEAVAVPVQSNGASSAPIKNSNFSVAIFIVLLIFFWPAAIVYAIVASAKK